jgi:hypothetical protein
MLNFQLSLLHHPWSVFNASSASTQYTAEGDLSLMTSKLQVPKGLVDENVSQMLNHEFHEVIYFLSANMLLGYFLF